MKSAVATLAALFLATPLMAQPAAEAPLERETPLPAFRTEAEAQLPPLPVEAGTRTPPTGTIYCPPEYAPMAGLILSWEGYADVLEDLAVGVTTGDPTATVWNVVDSTFEQTNVANYLQAAGANMDQIEFIVRGTDSVWVRDYGPRFIYEDGQRAIIDHTYNRPRPNDNLLNNYISASWGVPQYDIPLTHGGGNFHLFENGDAFMTDLILDENPGLTETDVVNLYQQYQNLNLTIYPGFPTWYDSTQHIDMWMMPAGDYRVIIGEYPASDTQVYNITENAVTDLQARGYTVFRTPGWNSGGTHYTYTNAVVLNNQVFIPYFGGSYTTQDAQAVAVFQQAFPNHTVIPVYCGSIIHAAGAIHCIVMHVPEANIPPEPQVELYTPNGADTLLIGDTYTITWNATDDVAVTGVDLYYSIDSGATYPFTIATGETNDGEFAWQVPDAESTGVRVKVIAYDADGNTGSDESDNDNTIERGPSRIISFPLDGDPGWTMQGAWQFGQPTGAGSHGGGPPAAYTGAYIYGFHLGGDYFNNLTQPYYLITTAMDCRGYEQVELRFQRWLAIEDSDFDTANIHISYDGSDWFPVWSHSGNSFNDGEWKAVSYDISTYADDQETVYIRWGLGPTDHWVTYPGWHLDDIELWGRPTAPVACPGDMDCDFDCDFDDITLFVTAIGDDGTDWRAHYEALYGTPPPCPFSNGDLDGDDDVDFDDISPFVEQIGSTCD